MTPQSAAQHKQSRAFTHKILRDYHPRATSDKLAKEIADQARDVSLEDENAHELDAPHGSTWENEEEKQKRRDAVIDTNIECVRAGARLEKNSSEYATKSKNDADLAMTTALQALFAQQQQGELTWPHHCG